MSTIHLIGGARTIHLLRSEHPDIFKGCPDTVDGVFVNSNVDCELHEITAGPWFDEYPFHLQDCKPEPLDIDEKQSWQKMNRGNLSKKQRRKLCPMQVS